MKSEKNEKDQEEEKAVRTKKIERAIWIHNKLIDRYPDLYRNLKKEFDDERE